MKEYENSNNQVGGKKRKLTAYNKFVKKEMLALRKQYPDKNVTELMKTIGERWRAKKNK